MNQIEFERKSDQLKSLRKKMEVLRKDPIIGTSWAKLEDELAQKDKDSILRIAVCGQYSSGKSSLVQALTGDSSIAIGAGVTTDQVKEYEWKDMRIADTPGIYAGRPEHDERSLDYIRKADLLIYMMTIQGFTREIGDNFKKLMLSKYAKKTMLLMNKRNQEAAENEENWIRDTRDFLGGDEMLRQFYFTIVDVEDYKMGMDENIPELVKESHFEEFLDKLNQFCENNDLMGRITSRVNMMDAFLTLNIEDLSRTHEKDEFTRRQIAVLEKANFDVDREVQNAGIRIHQKVQDIKNRLVGLLSDDTIKEFQTEYDHAESDLMKILHDDELTKNLEQIVRNLKQDMDYIECDALQYDKRMDEIAKKLPCANIPKSIDLTLFKTSVCGTSVALTAVSNTSIKAFASSAATNLQPLVKGVNIVKGTAAFLAVVALATEVVQLIKEQKHQIELENCRRDIRKTFEEIERKIGTQLEKTKNDPDSLGSKLQDLLKQVKDRVKQQEDLQKHKQELLEKLRGFKDELVKI